MSTIRSDLTDTMFKGKIEICFSYLVLLTVYFTNTIRHSDYRFSPKDIGNQLKNIKRPS